MSDEAGPVKLRRKPGKPLNQDPARVRRLRIRAGLSLTALAEAAGTSKGHLSEIESRSRSASPQMLAKLALALGCEISDLMPAEPRKRSA